MKKIVFKFAIGSLFCLLAGCSTGFTLSAEKCYKKGREKAQENKMALAYKYFDAATKKDPKNVQYQWAAATTAPNQNAAFVHTEAAWKIGLKRPDVLLALSRLSFHTEKRKALEYALNLYAEMPDSFRTPLFRSQIFYNYEEWDSCLAIILPLFAQSPTKALVTAIASVYGSKGDREKSRSFLQDCRKRNLLDGNGYVMLASLAAPVYRFRTIDSLFAEAKQNGLYNKDIAMEYSGFLVAQDRLDEAEKILDELKAPPAGEQNTLLNHRARVGLVFIYAGQGRRDKIVSLMQTVSGKTPSQKAEYALDKAMLDLFADSTQAFEELREAARKLPENPLIQLVLARENAKHKNYKEAVALYKKLPGIFIYSPRIMIELANALSLCGNDDEALAYINALHGHGLFTRPSLELFRNISFKKHLIEKSLAAQKLLEQKYSGDAGILWTGVALALQMGKTDSALALATVLCKKYPDEKQFEMGRISLYLIKKDYERVLAECARSSAPASLLAPLQARAYRQLGKNNLADSAYARGLADKKTPGLML
ncbi:MAG: hypothetical protein PHC61_14230, partial [Chitinivibrionales bacterium]|nr:hypothetical protein [Chitinivibrionales bacterium]